MSSSIQRMPLKRRRKSDKGKKPLSLSQWKAVKRLTNRTLNSRLETKYHVQVNTASSPDWSGVDALMNDITVGTADTQRIGDEIDMKSVQLKYVVTRGDGTNVVRAILFQWFDESTPTLADILRPASIGSIGGVVAHYHHDNLNAKPQKFQILYDKTHLVNDVGYPTALGKFSTSKFKHRRVQYSAASSNPVSNRLYLAFISDSAAAAHPSVNYSLRLRYTDA